MVMWWGGPGAALPAFALRSWFPSAELEFSSSSSQPSGFLGAEMKLLQWLGIWEWGTLNSSSFMTLSLLCLSLSYTAPRHVLGEPCEDEEVEGNLVVVYCYLLSLSLLLWIISTFLVSCVRCSSLTKFVCSESFFTFAFQIYCFSCGKRKCMCSWVVRYVYLLVLLLSPYLCTSICIGCLYYKCPTWKWAFLDSMHKALTTCVSFACVPKQNRSTQCMIFSSCQSFEWVRTLLLYRTCLCQCVGVVTACSPCSLCASVSVCIFCISFLLSPFFKC